MNEKEVTFDPSERFEVATALESRTWMLIDDLETTIRVLMKVDADDGRDAINRACEKIAALAANHDVVGEPE